MWTHTFANVDEFWTTFKSNIEQHGKQKYDLHEVERTEKVDLGGGRREEVEAAEATGNDRKVYVEEFPEVSDTSHRYIQGSPGKQSAAAATPEAQKTKEKGQRSA